MPDCGLKTVAKTLFYPIGLQDSEMFCTFATISIIKTERKV